MTQKARTDSVSCEAAEKSDINIPRDRITEEYLDSLDGEQIAEIIKKALANGEDISEYVPYMEESNADELAEELLKKGENIEEFLPMMSNEKIFETAKKALGKD